MVKYFIGLVFMLTTIALTGCGGGGGSEEYPVTENSSFATAPPTMVYVPAEEQPKQGE